MNPILMFVAWMAMLSAWPALARDRGQYAQTSPAISKWIKGLADKHGVGCCDTADGYPAR